MKKVLQMCEKTKDSQIKGESQLNSFSEAMDFMTNKFEGYERERQEKDKIIDSMISDMVNMNEKIEKLEMIVGRQEQYSLAIASYCPVSQKVNVKTLMI